jgi:hypothetical protein
MGRMYGQFAMLLAVMHSPATYVRRPVRPLYSPYTRETIVPNQIQRTGIRSPLGHSQGGAMGKGGRQGGVIRTTRRTGNSYPACGMLPHRSAGPPDTHRTHRLTYISSAVAAKTALCVCS